MQETRVQALVRENSTCRGAAKPGKEVEERQEQMEASQGLQPRSQCWLLPKPSLIQIPLLFGSPLWEMVQDGIDLKSIKWTQH
ncbi:hypothetical protein J1605_003216 [Eschrichtius robustus]|uniref:Uncharacterized protein n=1 Tax=Eschrichtius robustus TaxID=9764 RepID=A0AB34HS40_ESCRO|nr:hypothetical protein J1605_003216 [Eschrichtius robustus]